MKRFKILPALLLPLFVFIFAGAGAQQIIIRNAALQIEFNNLLQSRVNTAFPNASLLMNRFSNSEYIETKYFAVKEFAFKKKEQFTISDKTGNGTGWRLYGLNAAAQIEKVVTIKVYDNFKDVAFYSVQYINHGKKEIAVKNWINHQYNLLPSDDTTRFWSFQGSSHPDRRDWLQPVNPGFYDKNFMGMNGSDYGGGIPVVDLWRKDAGIGIGVTETVPRLVSLPVDYDKYGSSADVSINHSYPEMEVLHPGDTLNTFKTFVGVHTKDCFNILRNFSGYMQTKGIKAASPEPDAFEPIWCAWGYERDFTLKEILQTLPKVKELGIRWVGLDDGFQQAEGDWHTNKEHFPNGDADMKAFVDSVHAQGMKAVLWWAPLAADPGSKLLKANPSILLMQENGAPQYISWWDAFYMSPTDSTAIEETKKTVQLFLKEWGFDALKLDGQHMNACAPDYADGHGIDYPEQSFELMPQLFKVIYETARSIKPAAVIEFCPCGDCMSFFHMPYTNQFVASDPESSWQVRLKGKVYKALMPGTAYFGDHVELTDSKQDFASQVGIGAVPGTKFVWPATGVKSKDENFLSPEKESLFKKWISLYNEKMLSKGNYRGELYDIGYDYPETHCIEKDGALYYAFYDQHFSGSVSLRGLAAGGKYVVTDYFNNRELGNISGSKPELRVSFDGFLLLQVKKVE